MRQNMLIMFGGWVIRTNDDTSVSSQSTELFVSRFTHGVSLLQAGIYPKHYMPGAVVTRLTSIGT